MTALRERLSPNFSTRPTGMPVDMLVLHYTGMRDAAEALDRLCDSAAQVSAHYLIDEQGVVTRLVAEDLRAWHAGVSCWRGERDVNSRSIGIELANCGHEFGYAPFPRVQMEALVGLAHGILARWPIPPRNVVGHSDVAPLRKQDPGELFDWRWLAAQGIGLWPQPAPPRGDLVTQLAAYGYDLDPPNQLDQVVTAFQRHFRPARIDGKADEEILSLLAGLLGQV